MGQLRDIENLSADDAAETVVIGGGIAGMSTAFYLLKETELGVILVERDRVGMGTSARNGGQGVAAIERSFADMLRTMDGATISSMLNEIESGYQRLREICLEVGYSDGPIETVVWSGLSSMREVDIALEEMSLRMRYGAPVREITLASEILSEVEMPNEMKERITSQSHSALQRLLQTKESYIAAYPTPVSLINSGRLCQAIDSYLARNYRGRYKLYEGSPVTRIDLDARPKVYVGGTSIDCKQVVLCTNGYPLPELVAKRAPWVKKSLRRYVASMLGYEREDSQSPGAFIYFHEEGDPLEEPYFYITRRPYSVTGDDLLVVGGPQVSILDEIDHQEEYPSGVYDRIDGFMSRSYPEELDLPSMCWNGLMGYTEDGLRLVGPDPDVPGLWYNLGCNGVGLLPSLVGAKKLAGLINGH
jgi:glycine/D-amino acid oxidase-like deaminating enzyme